MGWCRLPDLNLGRENSGVVEIGGKLVAVGGREDQDNAGHGSFEIYDPENELWKLHTDPRIHRNEEYSTIIF
jgi:hypothetical protein